VFDYREERVGDAAIFRLTGKMDLEGTANLRKTFWERLTQAAIAKLILDLEGVPELEPSAVSLLVATKNVVAKWKCQLILTGLQPENHQLLEQTKLLTYFDVRDSIEDALQSDRLETAG